jgi:hypothetical protein
VTEAYLASIHTSVWPRRMMAVLLVATVCTLARPCVAQSISALVRFEDCQIIRVPKVYELLHVELANPVNTNVKRISVICGQDFWVRLQLQLHGGHLLTRSIHLQRYEIMERERVLALAISEIVTEAGQWPSARKDSIPPGGGKDAKRKAPPTAPGHLPQSRHPRFRHQQESLRGLGAMVAWQHMNRLDLIGPAGTIIRLYPVGLGWQWEASALFSREDTSLGQVKTMVVSTSLLPCMAWQRARFRWHFGLGIRVGLARMKGIPSRSGTHRGNGIIGAWYGPMAAANLGMVSGNILMSINLEAGFSAAGVVGHVPDDDIAVGDFWLRPGFLVAYVF